MTNDYKPDGDKAPVLDAVHIPFRRAILALARMAQDMAVKHKLEGAKDPYNEWRQLPDARRRLSNAAARHGDNPWQVNTKDGTHLHALHALWGWMASVELWEEEQEKLDAETPCCASPDAQPADDWEDRSGRVIEGPAGADWRERKAHGSVGPRCLAVLEFTALQCEQPASHSGAHNNAGSWW